jgi:hypothetical protein
VTAATGRGSVVDSRRGGGSGTSDKGSHGATYAMPSHTHEIPVDLPRTSRTTGALPLGLGVLPRRGTGQHGTAPSGVGGRTAAEVVLEEKGGGRSSRGAKGCAKEVEGWELASPPSRGGMANRSPDPL